MTLREIIKYYAEHTDIDMRQYRNILEKLEYLIRENELHNFISSETIENLNNNKY